MITPTNSDLSELKHHTFGTLVDISSSSSSSKYTCPSDGYIRAVVRPDGSGYSYVTITEDSGNLLVQKYTPYFSNAYHQDASVFFVKKGTILYVSSSYGSVTVDFMPLV